MSHQGGAGIRLRDDKASVKQLTEAKIPGQQDQRPKSKYKLVAGDWQKCHSTSGTLLDHDSLPNHLLEGPGGQSHSEIKLLGFRVRDPPI